MKSTLQSYILYCRFYTQVIKDHGFPSQSPIANDPDSGALSNSHLKMFTALVAICVYALI